MAAQTQESMPPLTSTTARTLPARFISESYLLGCLPGRNSCFPGTDRTLDCSWKGSMRAVFGQVWGGQRLDALDFRGPDELMELQAEAGVEAIFEHPLGEDLRVEEALVGAALAASVFAEGGREQDVFDSRLVLADELARELVVAA